MAGATFMEKFRGSFDLLLLFGRGIKPFEKEGTFRDAMRSLWIPVLMTPLNFVAPYFHHPQGLEDQPYSTVAVIVGAMGVLGFAAGVALGWLFAKAMGKMDRFWLWFQAGNWVTLPFNIIGLPFLVIACTDWFAKGEMDRVLTAITYYGVLVSGCIAFRAFKVSWEMAGFFALMSVMPLQLIYNALFSMYGLHAP